MQVAVKILFKVQKLIGLREATITTIVRFKTSQEIAQKISFNFF